MANPLALTNPMQTTIPVQNDFQESDKLEAEWLIMELRYYSYAQG